MASAAVIINNYTQAGAGTIDLSFTVVTDQGLTLTGDYIYLFANPIADNLNAIRQAAVDVITAYPQVRPEQIPSTSNVVIFSIPS